MENLGLWVTTTKPLPYSLGAVATEPSRCNCWPHEPSATREAITMRNPCTATREDTPPHTLATTRKKPMQQRRSSTAKNKQTTFFFKSGYPWSLLHRADIRTNLKGLALQGSHTKGLKTYSALSIQPWKQKEGKGRSPKSLFLVPEIHCPVISCMC